MEGQLKILELINELLNIYTQEGNVLMFFEGRSMSEAWEVMGVEKRDFDDAENGEKVVIY
jgi:CobQ-like glutamine amidotransferase family enzyme